MNAREMIKYLMDTESVSYTELGERLNMSRQAIWARLNGGKGDDVFMGHAAEMAEAMGYRVYIVPDDVKKPTGAIEITNE